MKKTCLFLILSFLLTIKTSYAQENLKETTTKKNSSDNEKNSSIDDNELSENSLDDYQETANLRQRETQILFELTKELKGNFYLDEETFKEHGEFTPEHMINLYLKTHKISKQSYTYSKIYKRQCKAFSVKNLKKLKEKENFLNKETWTFEEINEINIKLNNISKEKHDKEANKKIKQQEKSEKKRNKIKKREERKKEKKLKKRNTLFSRKKNKKTKKQIKETKKKEEEEKEEKEEKEKIEKEKIEKEKKNKNPYKKNDFIIITDINSFKTMAKDNELEEDRIYLKVSEPLFTKNKKRAMIFVSHENKEILDNYLVVLIKKSKGWCIQGKIQDNKQSIEKIRPTKKEIDPYDN